MSSKLSNMWTLGLITARKRALISFCTSGDAPGKRAYHLNFPLYNGVTSMEIGVPKGATFVPTPPLGSILNAVRKLGLRLEARPVPIDVIVVESADKAPSEN